jgi:hypothetical protein
MDGQGSIFDQSIRQCPIQTFGKKSAARLSSDVAGGPTDRFVCFFS